MSSLIKQPMSKTWIPQWYNKGHIQERLKQDLTDSEFDEFVDWLNDSRFHTYIDDIVAEHLIEHFNIYKEEKEEVE